MPVLVAGGVLAAGRPLVVAGLKGFCDERLAGLADRGCFASVGLTRVGEWIRHFQKHNVTRVVMIGSVRKGDMHGKRRLLAYRPDLRTAKLWYGKLRHDKRDNAALLVCSDELAREGINLMDSTEYCSEHLAHEGVMTRTQPSASQQADGVFGFEIARQSARLDIGQSLAVRERDIIAVEAVEGTDAMIRRAGELCPRGQWTMVKVARPDQDMRFDVPTIGPHTIKNLQEAGCSLLVIEAEKTLIVDKPTTLELADRAKLAIMGMASAS